ncbi:hypothetical protein SJ05684_c30400 [Sinorhizobium sojae CCBAU 05684]|uniref:Helix-turn-helix domain-containing protein n=1 Tax=Sinorhizobium sojae CCBAU 05684 TaxID=716928 RepID=A0A249PFL6_9HYPH|nr:AlpA family phage regulatory protein [Sinorhizobium sojae]ASY64464.1 hypothetical protein SJ05684_c30400 [Sinorhizobium sojae CCBAU 05684]
MRHLAQLKRSEIYVSARDVMDRYDISRSTLDRWIKKRGFPAPRMIVGKRHFLLSQVDAWDVEQCGVEAEPQGEIAFGMPIVSGLVQSYDDLVAAMIERRKDLGLSCIELDALSGMQEGYANKLENWRKQYGRGMGPDTFPLWLGGLRLGLVLVELPRRPRKRKQAVGEQA